MKKISSLVVTSILFSFLYFSFFRSFPVSSVSHFFLTANNKKNKKKNKKVSQNKKINQNKKVNQNKKINNEVVEESKENDKENSYSFLDSKENILFLFLLGVFLIIFIFFFLYASFPVIIEKFKNKKKEEDKKTKINRIANRLLSEITLKLFEDYNIYRDTKGEIKISFGFFNLDGLLCGLNDFEIANNFLNFAFEESFKRSVDDDANSVGLNFTEIIKKIEEKKKIDIKVFCKEGNFMKHLDERNYKDDDHYFFIYENFVKAFFNFFNIGYRVSFKSKIEKNQEKEILKEVEDSFSGYIIQIINKILDIFFSRLQLDEYRGKFFLSLCDEINHEDGDSFFCSFKHYKHEYRDGDEKNFCAGTSRDNNDNRYFFNEYNNEYNQDRDSLRSLGRRKRDGQDIKFKKDFELSAKGKEIKIEYRNMKIGDCYFSSFHYNSNRQQDTLDKEENQLKDTGSSAAAEQVPQPQPQNMPPS